MMKLYEVDDGGCTAYVQASSLGEAVQVSFAMEADWLEEIEEEELEVMVRALNLESAARITVDRSEDRLPPCTVADLFKVAQADAAQQATPQILCSVEG